MKQFWNRIADSLNCKLIDRVTLRVVHNLAPLIRRIWHNRSVVSEEPEFLLCHLLNLERGKISQIDAVYIQSQVTYVNLHQRPHQRTSHVDGCNKVALHCEVAKWHNASQRTRALNPCVVIFWEEWAKLSLRVHVLRINTLVKFMQSTYGHIETLCTQ